MLAVRPGAFASVGEFLRWDVTALFASDNKFSGRTGQTGTMASLSVHSDRLEIHLTRAERTLALRRDSIVVQRENIRSVSITEDPWIWLRGIRSPGSMIPLVLAAGTWKFHGGKDFVSIKRHRAAVVIDLVDEEFARVILTSQHAADFVDSLKLPA